MTQTLCNKQIVFDIKIKNNNECQILQSYDIKQKIYIDSMSKQYNFIKVMEESRLSFERLPEQKPRRQARDPQSRNQLMTSHMGAVGMKTKLQPITNNKKPVQEVSSKRIRKGYGLANFDQAIEYSYSQCYLFKEMNSATKREEWVRFEVFQSNKKFKESGLGVYLYLELMKRLLITFMLMSAVLAVEMVNNYQGTGLSNYSSSFTLNIAKTSIGNLKDSPTSSYLVTTLCDVFSMVAFFIFYLNWICFHNSVVASSESDIKTVNPATYSLAVTGFDSADSDPTLSNKLKDHIQSLFPGKGAYQTEIIYNYKGSFSKFVQYEQIIESVEKEVQIIRQTHKSNDKLNQLLAELKAFQEDLLKASKQFSPMFAIVHFKTIRGKIDFLNLCRKYYAIDNVSNALARCFCCSEEMPAAYKFQGKYMLLLRESALARPQQINWQNIEIEAGSRLLRWLSSVLLVVLCIAITSALIIFSTLYVSTISSCATFNSNTTLVAATAAGGTTLYCYCSENIATIYTDAATNAACATLTNTILVTNVLQIAASVVSSVSNIILIILIGLIARYILRPTNIPNEFSFIFVSVFISNYINSVIMPLVLNGNIFGVESVNYLSFLNFIDFANLTLFLDFTSDWYALISPYYVNLIIIGALTPIISLVITAVRMCIRDWLVRSACESNDKQNPLIQKEANAKLTSYEFKIAQEQAQLSLYVFLVVMYCGLMPVIVPIATVGLAIWYTTKKALIVKYSVRVPANENLSSQTITMLPFMILFHALMSIWSHTTPGVFQSGASVATLSLTVFNNTIDRIFNDLIILAELGFIAVYIVIDFTLIYFFNCLINCCKNQLAIPPNLAQIENADFADRTNAKNICKSYKLINSNTYGLAKKAYEELIYSKSKQKKQIDQYNPQNQ